MKESDLAQKFVDYLSCYDLYFEVDFHRCVDIVALNENLSMAFEVKTNFNFKVFEQAINNRPNFNYSYIAVPVFNDYNIQKKLCEDYGIGLLIYDNKRMYNSVYELISPKFNRHTDNKYLISRLHEHNKKSLPGTKSGDTEKITAFKITVEKAVLYVKKHPGCTIKEMINNISHHYNNSKTGCNNIYRWIHNGVIKELKLENRKLFLSDFEKIKTDK